MLISENTKKFILEHVEDDVFRLGFHASRYPEVEMHVAVVQIEGHQKAKLKVPSWYANPDIIYPPHLALEQCTSEMTANYKASLVEGDTMVDLTGGFGVDSSFLARKFAKAVYVEQQDEFCELAAHNFEALGLTNIETVNEEATDYLSNMEKVDLIYIDPARRNKQGGKVFALSDCEPDITEIIDQLLDKAQKVLVKLSPMLDVGMALQQMKNATEVHIISSNNECKELLLLLDREQHPSPSIYCININKTSEQSFSFNKDEESAAECEYTSTLRTFLYEPNTSVLKAGAFKIIGSRFNLYKLNPNSHLYTSDELISNFPGKVFRITDHTSFNKKDLHSFLSDMKKANIVVRNFTMTAVELHKRFKLADGGDDYLFATTLENGQHTIIRGEKLQF